MVTNYEHFKEYELFPSLFECIDRAFPTLHFKRKGNRWESNYHLDEQKDGQGKVISFVYGNSKFCAIDIARGEKKGLIDLYMNLSRCDFITAIKKLAECCNLTLPNSNSEEWREYEERQHNRENANKVFKEALWSGSDEANRVLDYLRGSRKWTDGEIRKAELGLITTSIRTSLPDGDSYKGVVRKDGRIIGGVGTTHLLTIPYRNGSRLFGFKFREIGSGIEPKYLNTYGIGKTNGLFGIGIDVKDIVIVEGELDALHAQVLGADNVVATTGNGATETQIQDAVRRGAEKFTLLFDNDIRGKGFITETINAIQKTGKSIFVAFLPSEVNDTDEYLASHSLEDFKQIINEAIPYSSYLFGEILHKYEQKEEKEGIFTHKDREAFFTDVERLINSPYIQAYEREDVYRLMEQAQIENSLSFRIADFREWADKDFIRKQTASRAENVRNASAQINKALEGGNIDEALKLMRETANSQSGKDKETEYAKVFTPSSPVDYSKFLSEIKEGIPTGFTFRERGLEEELTLNSGLTFICAYRGHGKTTFLNNIALNDARRNLRLGNGKSVLYFSYEVDKRRLIADLLNTYVNDKDISQNPSKTIQGYFKGKGAEFFKTSDGVHHYENFVKAKETFLKDYLSSGALVIVEENYKVEELLRAIKWYKAKHDISIICIDYAQLLYSEDYTRQRTEEIKKVVNDIKDFANKEGIAFVLAAQFNRDVDSPISVDTKSIGEGGDFERIADTCIGLYNLKELKPLPKNKEEEKEACKLLSRLMGQTITEPQKIENKLFVRLMKRRYGYYPLDVVLDWEGRTKYIKPNKPSSLEVKEEQKQLFNEKPLEDADLAPRDSEAPF